MPRILQELTMDRIGAEADLRRTLGTLRYLQGLKAARQHEEQAANGPADPASPSPTRKDGRCLVVSHAALP